MKKLNEIKLILQKHQTEITKEYYVKNLGIFGSYATGRQKKDSDIDILVDFNANIGLFEFVNLKNYLNELIGIKVDLVMKTALKKRIGKRIMKEVIHV